VKELRPDATSLGMYSMGKTTGCDRRDTLPYEFSITASLHLSMVPVSVASSCTPSGVHVYEHQPDLQQAHKPHVSCYLHRHHVLPAIATPAPRPSWPQPGHD
jgi:hypothetical protein